MEKSRQDISMYGVKRISVMAIEENRISIEPFRVTIAICFQEGKSKTQTTLFLYCDKDIKLEIPDK
jgi:hypothetical protein